MVGNYWTVYGYILLFYINSVPFFSGHPISIRLADIYTCEPTKSNIKPTQRDKMRVLAPGYRCIQLWHWINHKWENRSRSRLRLEFRMKRMPPYPLEVLGTLHVTCRRVQRELYKCCNFSFLFQKEWVHWEIQFKTR